MRGSEFHVATIASLTLLSLVSRPFALLAWWVAPASVTFAVTLLLAYISYSATSGFAVAGNMPSTAGVAIEVAMTLFACYWCSGILVGRDVRGAEQRAREDFRSALALKLKRESSRELVRSLVPMHVIREVRFFSVCSFFSPICAAAEKARCAQTWATALCAKAGERLLCAAALCRGRSSSARPPASPAGDPTAPPSPQKKTKGAGGAGPRRRRGVAGVGFPAGRHLAGAPCIS